MTIFLAYYLLVIGLSVIQELSGVSDTVYLITTIILIPTAVGVTIFMFYMYYKLLSRYTVQAKALTVAGVFLGTIVMDIALLVIRNNPRIDNTGLVILQETEPMQPEEQEK